MGEDDARIDVADEGALQYWSEIRRTVSQVGAEVNDVREHLFGGFTTAGPSS